MVGTLGLPMSVTVYPANVHEIQVPRLQRILADGGYRGDAVRDATGKLLRCGLDIVLRSDKQADKFVPLPKRLIVERTFSWFENFRRLTMDYEYRADTHLVMVHVAAIKLFLNKIFQILKSKKNKCEYWS